MRKVEIAPGIHSSVIGFECAPIMGPVGARDAERVLGMALDAGVNHFDLARSYGYGGAEKFVGRYLKGRREQVILASKFGIKTTWKAGLLKPLKPLIRSLKGSRGKSVPSPPPAAKPPSPSDRKDHFHQRIDLTPENMRLSLEKSLQALGTDYLDVFLIHEPPAKVEKAQDLAATADDLKKEGKIRSWGLAFEWHARGVLESDFPLYDLLQFNCSPAGEHYGEACSQFGSVPNILFAPFLDVDPAQRTETLNRLFSDFPSSVVLCPMFDPKSLLESVETRYFEQ